MNPAAMVALIDYREIDGEERPVIIASSEILYFDNVLLEAFKPSILFNNNSHYR